MAGRPSSFTPEKTTLILGHVRQGCYLTAAAEAAGVSRRTVQRWLRRGLRPGEADRSYREFRHAYRQARAEARIELERCVHGAGKINPELALKKLERLHPEDWSQHKNLIKQLTAKIAELEAKLNGEGKSSDPT